MDLQEPTVAEATQPTEWQGVREPSYWEKAVWLSFNPSGDESVQKIKELYAQIIDIMDNVRTSQKPDPIQWWSPEAIRLASVAITKAQTAQMRAVKALTWRD